MTLTCKLSAKNKSLIKSINSASAYLHSKGAKNNRAEDGVPEDAIEDVPLSVDFSGIYLIEELHHDEGVEDDGVVLRWRSMERSITATVNVKDLLTCSRNKIKY